MAHFGGRISAKGLTSSDLLHMFSLTRETLSCFDLTPGWLEILLGLWLLDSKGYSPLLLILSAQLRRFLKPFMMKVYSICSIYHSLLRLTRSYFLSTPCFKTWCSIPRLLIYGYGIRMLRPTRPRDTILISTTLLPQTLY